MRAMQQGRVGGGGEYQLAKGVATSSLLLKTEIGSPGNPHWLLEYDLAT